MDIDISDLERAVAESKTDIRDLDRAVAESKADTRDIEEILAKADWVERLHPRDNDGQFTSSGGGGSDTEVRASIAADTQRKILFGDHAGTPDDPVPCGDDIERAAKVIHEGGNVKLDQPDQVATLLDKLRDIAKDAEAKGEKAPLYDLCKVSVPGTNLFCQDAVTGRDREGNPTKISRVQMPQFSTTDPIPGSAADKAPRNAKGEVNLSEQFAEHLASSGVGTHTTTIDASHLRASQNELNGAKVAGIAGAIDAGKIDPTDPKNAIYVTRDNYVIDGHHRWAANVAKQYTSGETIEMPVIVVDMDIGSALTVANYWTDQMGIPPADASKKGADPWLYRTMTRVPEMADVIQKFIDSQPEQDDCGCSGGSGKRFDPSQPRDERGRWVVTGFQEGLRRDDVSAFQRYEVEASDMNEAALAAQRRAHEEFSDRTTYSFVPQTVTPIPANSIPGVTAGDPRTPTAMVNWTRFDTPESRLNDARKYESQHVIVDLRSRRQGGSPSGTLHVGESTLDVGGEQFDPADVRGLAVYGNWAKAFDPAEHPRDDHGRFAETPGGGNPLAEAATTPRARSEIAGPGFGPLGDPYRTSYSELPDKVYHVAPASEHDSIEATGLDAGGHSWNWALSQNDRDAGGNWNSEIQSYEGAGSEDFGYRPEGVYVFADPKSAVSYSEYKTGQQQGRLEHQPGQFEIYEVDAQALGNLPADQQPDLLRNPELVQMGHIDDKDAEMPLRDIDEIFDDLRTVDYGGEEGEVDGREWVLERVPPEFVRTVKPYELKDQVDWTDDDIDAYYEDHPEDDVDPAFTAEPHERLTALAGKWSDWERQGITEKSSAEIAALDDPHLKIEDTGDSLAGMGRVAARWQGEYVEITPGPWDESDPESRRFLLAHETSHAAAADILANYEDKDELLAPFRNTPNGSTYSEHALVFPDEPDPMARTPEEMMSDVGATLLLYGRNVLWDRFESEKQYDISPTPPDPRLVALYDTVAAALDRVGNPPPVHAPAKAFDPSEHPRDSHGRFAETPGGGVAVATAPTHPAGLTRKDYAGEVGNKDHITATENGWIPTKAIQFMRGVEGEVPGAHRNRTGEAWEKWKDELAHDGIKEPIFISVDHGEQPKISEGNHRRDAAVELGMETVPVEIRYFGHAEQEGSVTERAGLVVPTTVEAKKFASTHEAETYLADAAGDWGKDPDVFSAMRSWWDREGYKWMNTYARKGQAGVDKRIDQAVKRYESQYVHNTDEDVQKWREHLEFEASQYVEKVPKLDEAIRTAPPLTESITVYRGVTPGVMKGLEVGDTFSDDGFVATAGSRADAGAWREYGTQVMIEITLPAGTPCSFNPAHGDEVVLPRGSSFKIIERDGNTMKVEYVP